MVGYSYNPNAIVYVTSKASPKYKTSYTYRDVIQENEAGGDFIIRHLETMLDNVNKAYSMIQEAVEAFRYPSSSAINYFVHFMFALMYTGRDDEVAIKSLLKEITDSCTIKIDNKEVDTKEFLHNVATDMHNIFEADYKKLKGVE